MLKAEATVNIKKNPMDLFNYLSDVEQMPTWRDEVRSVERISDGPPAVYTVSVGLPYIFNFTETYTVLESVPEKRIRAVFENPTVRFEEACDLATSAAGTAMTYRITMEVKGLLAYAEPLIAPVFQMQIENDVKNLKRVLEEDYQFSSTTEISAAEYELLSEKYYKK